MEPKTIDYTCIHCKHEWSLNYPQQAIVPSETKCPSCKKFGKNQRPHNAFRARKIPVTYICPNCQAIIKQLLSDPPFNWDCMCGTAAIRSYGNVEFEKESDNISKAAQTMLYSQLPSGKNKVNF